MREFEVHYTGLVLDPRTVLAPRKWFNGPYPEHWERYQFDEQDFADAGRLRTLDRWLEQHIEGRWGSYMVARPDLTSTVVILFEDPADAVLFRLSEGENFYNDNPHG